MVSCPKSVIAPTAAAGPLSVAKVSSTWTKVCATASRMASARSRAGRVLVSRSTVTAVPPIGRVWRRLPCVPPNGPCTPDALLLVHQSTTLLTCCIPNGVLLVVREQDGHGPAGWSEPALSTRWDPDRRENLVYPGPNPLPPRWSGLTEHAEVSKHTLYQDFSG